MKTPILKTDRLILRPFCIEDVKDVFEGWESDPDVARYMFWTSHNDINKTTDWVKTELTKIEADDWYRWAIALKESGDLIGTLIIYFEEEYANFEVAYNLGKKAWGFGYTTEAMQEAIKFAKGELGIKVIMARHAKENSASGKVLKKLGFNYIKDIPYQYSEEISEGKEYMLKL